MGKKYKRKVPKRPKFKKFYRFNQQDEFLIFQERKLQKIHSKLAWWLFGDLSRFKFGDWTIETEGITLHIDPVMGSQAEISGTFLMPLLERLKIHIELFKLLKKGYSISKAVEICLLTSTTQSKNWTSLKSLR